MQGEPVTHEELRSNPLWFLVQHCTNLMRRYQSAELENVLRLHGQRFSGLGERVGKLVILALKVFDCVHFADIIHDTLGSEWIDMDCGPLTIKSIFRGSCGWSQTCLDWVIGKMDLHRPTDWQLRVSVFGLIFDTMPSLHTAKQLLDNLPTPELENAFVVASTTSRCSAGVLKFVRRMLEERIPKGTLAGHASTIVNRATWMMTSMTRHPNPCFEKTVMDWLISDLDEDRQLWTNFLMDLSYLDSLARIDYMLNNTKRICRQHLLDECEQRGSRQTGEMSGLLLSLTLFLSRPHKLLSIKHISTTRHPNVSQLLVNFIRRKKLRSKIHKRQFMGGDSCAAVLAHHIANSPSTALGMSIDNGIPEVAALVINLRPDSITPHHIYQAMLARRCSWIMSMAFAATAGKGFGVLQLQSFKLSFSKIVISGRYGNHKLIQEAFLEINNAYVLARVGRLVLSRLAPDLENHVLSFVLPVFSFL